MHDSTEQKALAAALKRRPRRFALDVIRLCRQFPRTMDGSVVAKQLIRSATPTAANYRAACWARSSIDFVSKITLVSEEADESELWLDVTIAAGILSDKQARELLEEAGHLTAIFTASRETAKRNLARQRNREVQPNSQSP